MLAVIGGSYFFGAKHTGGALSLAYVVGVRAIPVGEAAEGYTSL